MIYPDANETRADAKRESNFMKTTSAKWLANVSSTKLSLVVTGMFLAATSTALATVRYVWQSSPDPTPPYATWTTAATNIQDAVDAAAARDEIVVTNGVYTTGSRTIDGLETNRVAVDKPVTVRSVNGPEATIIDGLGAMRCVYLTNNAALVGFTVTNGSTFTGPTRPPPVGSVVMVRGCTANPPTRFSPTV